MTKQKIAILGGGMGSLSSAYWLTSQAGWQDQYEITVYQMGWRLGGKGASSRDPQNGERNLEHGFHILFGFYENTFATMRACYEALARNPESPLAEFIARHPEDEINYPLRYAMGRHKLFVNKMAFNGGWYTHEVEAPYNDLLPGDRVSLHIPWVYVYNMIDWIIDIFKQAQTELVSHVAHVNEHSSLLATLKSHAPHVFYGIEHEVASLSQHESHFYVADKLLKHLEKYARDVFLKHSDLLIRLLSALMDYAWFFMKHSVKTQWSTYSAWINLDFLVTSLIGSLRDEIFTKGFDSINNQNFIDWFRRNAPVKAGAELTVSSTLMQGSYDASFAYLDGDSVTPPAPPARPLYGNPQMEAGTMLRGAMRLMLGYKGACGWYFQAGAGEVLFTPLYELLHQRGVKFKFFHKTKRLEVAADGSNTIDSIIIEKQVNLTVGEYEPLVMLNGIGSWPLEPLYDQIVDGAILKERKINLESNWTDWQPVETLNLRRGVDFDKVILGISLGALDSICQPLSIRSDKWDKMLTNVKTTRTQAYQLWMNQDIKSLGWSEASPLAVLGIQPINTWGDMSQIIKNEDWLPEAEVKSVGYFCGPMQDDPNQPVPPDPAYPQTQTALVEQTTYNYLSKEAWTIWPNAATPDSFCWEWLVDLKNSTGAERLNAQYFRANIDPSERYVLSVPGSTQYRLTAGETDFTNLYIAGDWIKTGVDCGCMEAAVMSGMQASRAISGYPKFVPGEKDFALDPHTESTGGWLKSLTGRRHKEKITEKSHDSSNNILGIIQNWEHLLFAHWSLPPEVIKPLIPAPLTLDTYDGNAWISIVPLWMRGVRPYLLPALPWLSNFLAINFRTYVKHGDKSGVMFFSLEANQPIAIGIAKLFYYMPYMNARISNVQQADGLLHCVSERTQEKAPPAHFNGEYGPDGPVFFAGKGTLEEWLTERYYMFTHDRSRNRVYRGAIFHRKWELQLAQFSIKENSLATALNLELPSGSTKPVLAHYVRRVHVNALPVIRIK